MLMFWMSLQTQLANNIKVGGSVDLLAGRAAEGSEQAASMGWGQQCEDQQGQVLVPALGSQQHQAVLQAGDRVS